MAQVIEFIMNTTGITSSICTSLSRQQMMAIYGNNWQYIYIYCNIYIYNIIYYIYIYIGRRLLRPDSGLAVDHQAPILHGTSCEIRGCQHVQFGQRKGNSKVVLRGKTFHPIFLEDQEKQSPFDPQLPLLIKAIVWAHFYRIHRPNFFKAICWNNKSYSKQLIHFHWRIGMIGIRFTNQTVQDLHHL